MLRNGETHSKALLLWEERNWRSAVFLYIWCYLAMDGSKQIVFV